MVVHQGWHSQQAKGLAGRGRIPHHPLILPGFADFPDVVHHELIPDPGKHGGHIADEVPILDVHECGEQVIHLRTELLVPEHLDVVIADLVQEEVLGDHGRFGRGINLEDVPQRRCEVRGHDEGLLPIHGIVKGSGRSRRGLAHPTLAAEHGDFLGAKLADPHCDSQGHFSC